MRNGRAAGYSNSVATHMITFGDGDASNAEKLLMKCSEESSGGNGQAEWGIRGTGCQ